MKTVVVYESMFGNTEQVAQHIADALRATGATATVVEVSQAEPGQLHGAELLVVGAPTHAFSLSRPNTREDAVRQGADPARTMLGVREWLATLETAFPAAADRPRVAVFDTRAEKVRRLPGSAAKRAVKVLRARGFESWTGRPASTSRTSRGHSQPRRSSAPRNGRLVSPASPGPAKTAARPDRHSRTRLSTSREPNPRHRPARWPSACAAGASEARGPVQRPAQAG